MTVTNTDVAVHDTEPLNFEVRLSRLAEGLSTPNERFYVRSHFPSRALDASTWRLQVRGLVGRPTSLTLRELQEMPAQTMPVVLECAGNGRKSFNPPAEGVPWGLGAVSSAEWRGVTLKEVLERAGVTSSATHLIMRGADGFERSLSLEQATSVPVLLAYQMNGEALPEVHGHPLRAIVPSWFAVASVKSLIEIEVADHPSHSPFQVQHYIYEWTRGREPVTLQRVRSVITQPEEGATVDRGVLPLRGLAWSGSAPLGQVHVSVNGGEWIQARLVDLPDRYNWRAWDAIVRVETSGPVAIRSRATAIDRETQPEHAEWNRLGFGNNSIQVVTVRSR